MARSVKREVSRRKGGGSFGKGLRSFWSGLGNGERWALGLLGLLVFVLIVRAAFFVSPPLFSPAFCNHYQGMPLDYNDKTEKLAFCSRSSEGMICDGVPLQDECRCNYDVIPSRWGWWSEYDTSRATCVVPLVEIPPCKLADGSPMTDYDLPGVVNPTGEKLVPKGKTNVCCLKRQEAVPQGDGTEVCGYSNPCLEARSDAVCVESFKIAEWNGYCSSSDPHAYSVSDLSCGDPQKVCCVPKPKCEVVPTDSPEHAGKYVCPSFATSAICGPESFVKDPFTGVLKSDLLRLSGFQSTSSKGLSSCGSSDEFGSCYCKYSTTCSKKDNYVAVSDVMGNFQTFWNGCSGDGSHRIEYGCDNDGKVASTVLIPCPTGKSCGFSGTTLGCF